MASHYTRVRKGPFTCATHQDGTQLYYVRVYHRGREHMLGRYSTEHAAHLAYYEFRLQQALQLFPPLTAEQQDHLQDAIAHHPSVKDFLTLFARTWRPIQFAQDFRIRRHSSSPKRCEPAAPPHIPGIRHIRLKNGESRWRLVLTHNQQKKFIRFTSENEAHQYYHEAQVLLALEPFPSVTTSQRNTLTRMRQKDPSLRPILDLLINSALRPATIAPSVQPPKHAPLFQSGRPYHHKQRPTGPTPDPDISFAAYAERWFRANLARWQDDSREVTRSICTNHLIPAFGSVRVRDLTSTQIAVWLKGQLRSYSVQQCRHMRGRLTSILYAAMAYGLIPKNPATDPDCMLPPQHTQYQCATLNLKGESTHADQQQEGQ